MTVAWLEEYVIDGFQRWVSVDSVLAHGRKCKVLLLTSTAVGHHFHMFNVGVGHDVLENASGNFDAPPFSLSHMKHCTLEFPKL